MAADDPWENDDVKRANDLFQKLGRRLKKMADVAPMVRCKSPELADMILYNSFLVDCESELASGDEFDVEGRKQLSEDLPVAQHLCAQLCEKLTVIEDYMVQRFRLSDPFPMVNTRQLIQKIESSVSEIINLLHPQQGEGSCGNGNIPMLTTTSRVMDGEVDEINSLASGRVSNGFKRLKTHHCRMKEEVPDNSYEAKLRADIVPPSEMDVTLNDIGALEETKKLIYELVILPIRRPEVFKGGLLKPCKGILLFGPPGTGKTMLAKAIAKESGANFINVSSASIFDKWVGESEKNVKALFTLAAKVAPAVIFVDEVDSFLGRRTTNESDSASRKIKNEFMSLWDGLQTKAGKQILVLGATNRPFDLDEAIIRRFERRILVDLPCKMSRESILEKLLAKESIERMDYKELSVITEGYTGSDLKNLCTTAAYLPLRELLEQERVASEGTGEKPFLRPLNMDDIKQASKQVAASFSADGSSMLSLKEWNDLYGGGSRKK